MRSPRVALDNNSFFPRSLCILRKVAARRCSENTWSKTFCRIHKKSLQWTPYFVKLQVVSRITGPGKIIIEKHLPRSNLLSKVPDYQKATSVKTDLPLMLFGSFLSCKATSETTGVLQLTSNRLFRMSGRSIIICHH